jgi:DNA-binding response OmpR family regulator
MQNNPSPKPHLLLIEDDAIIASGLVYAFENEGFFVTHVRDVVSFYNEEKLSRYDLAIVDIGLPDGTGFELVAALKDAGVSMLFLTAVDDERKVIRAFAEGAEDYVTKPFRLGELTARVKAILHRRLGLGDKITLGDLVIHLDEGKAYANNTAVELTALEYRLLLVFANHKRQVLTRGQILNMLWDSAGVFVEDNTLTVYVKRLREKLGDALVIETVRGVGYRCHVH